MRSVLSGIGRRGIGRAALALPALLLVGCATASSTVRTDAGPAVVASDVAAEPTYRGLGAETSAPPADGLAPIPPLAGAPLPRYAQAPSATDAVEADPYDPWEPFNETMFEVNLKLDKYVLKPAANVYRHAIPEPFQVLIANGFDNIRWVPRFVNNLLQGKVGGAGREMARFLINSTAGIGGLFDPAKDYWGIRPSREDFGQTLGVWGAGPGPYLVLPLLPPLTVRDGIGYGVDSAMDPLSYVLPFFWSRLGMRLGDTLNERALNYDLFQGVEETTIDLYSSVRHFYLQRRERQIQE
ncbi:MAG: MlaA family lipoprotein [Candidatus Rokuibacteriota bacterium]